jgi:hypothetical protein
VLTLFVLFPVLWLTGRRGVVAEEFETRRVRFTNPAATSLPD